jgi:hypothetical protein
MKKPPDERFFTSVKTTLNSFCRNDTIKDKIRNHVENCSRLAFEVYELANLHVVKLLRSNESIPSLNQSFFVKCCYLVSEMYRRKPKNVNIDPSLGNTYKNLYAKQKPKNYVSSYRDYSGSIINYLAKLMEISVTNHLVLNFEARFRKYIARTYPESTAKSTKKRAYEIWKGTNSLAYDGDDSVVEKYRGILNDKPPDENRVRKDPTGVLKIYDEILTAYLKDDTARRFSLLPRKNLTANYITIDTSALKDLLAELKIKSHLKKNFDDTYWPSLFNVSNFETSGKTFHNAFLTDGVGVSLIFEKTSHRRENEKEVTYDGEILMGLDPGRRALFVGRDQDDFVVARSTRNYRHDAYITKASKRRENCYEKNSEIGKYVKNTPTGKTNVIEDLLTRTKYCLTKLIDVVKFHHDKPFRRWKLTTWIRKKATINKLCKLLIRKDKKSDPDKVLIGFGNFSNGNSCIKGHCKGPVLTLKRELRRWTKVIDVDEYNTSKKCCECWSEMTKMKHDDVSTYSVLRCENNECGIVIDRDVNASKNIRLLLRCRLGLEEKPVEFERPKTFLPKTEETREIRD